MYAMVYRANSTAGAVADVPVALDFDLDFEYEDVLGNYLNGEALLCFEAGDEAAAT